MKARNLMGRAAAAAFAVCLLLAQVFMAAAHANYVRSVPEADSASPTPPKMVQAWFSEAVDPAASSLSVHDTAGHAVDNGDWRVAPGDGRSLIITLQPLEQGTYTVVWSTLSAVDGHSAKGAFPFTVGPARNTGSYAALVNQVERVATALQPPPLADALERWFTYMALMLVLGGFVFAPLVLAVPALARLSVAVARRRRQVLWLSLGLLCLSVVAGIGLRIAETGIATAVSGRFGMVVAARLVLVVILALMLYRRLDTMRLIAVPCAALMLSQSFLSHSAAETDWLLPTLADWLHLVAAGVWLGGVAMFAAVVAPLALAQRADHSRLKELGLAILRFSPIAVVCVVVIYATGLLQSLWLLGSLDALITTAYGRALAAKILLAVVLIGFGAFHQMFVAPDLDARDDKQVNRAQRSGAQFRRSIIAEAVVCALVLAAAGALTSLPPGRDVAPGNSAAMSIQTLTAGDLSMAFGVTPSTTGLDQFAARVSNADGSFPQDVEAVFVRFKTLEMDMGEAELVLQPYAPGYFTGHSSVLSMEGYWQADLIVRRTARADLHAVFKLTVY